MRAPITPSLTMGEIYGPDRVYAPRAHPRTCHWISRDPALLDALTGNQLAIAGDMPIVCSTGTTTAPGLELLAEAGLRLANSTKTYSGEQSAIDAVSGLAKVGVKAVVQHVYPDDVLDESAFWIPPKLLSYLNNKANLAELAPAANIASRCVMSRQAFLESGAVHKLPVVLKAATDLSTGGGADVAICRVASDLTSARERLADCDRLVVESYLATRRSCCLNYAVMPDGTARYLGFADQDIGPNGRYRGNWISLGSTLPAEPINIGLGIVERGASLGYRGFVGIDIVEAEGGRWIVLDLNFRVNGSTAAVLLAPAIQRALGQCILHLRGFVCKEGLAQLTSAARTAHRSGALIPVGAFDAAAAGYAGQPSRLLALVVAESQTGTRRIEAELAAAGLV